MPVRRRNRHLPPRPIAPLAPPPPIIHPLKDKLFKAYAKPAHPDMAVVLVYHNYANSVRIFQNLLLVKHKMEVAHIPVFIAEIAEESYPYAFAPAPNIFQYRTNSYLFYKENAAANVVKQLPSTYTKICMLDADIIFDDEAWYDKISKVLNDADLCQCFSRGSYLDVTHATILKEVSRYSNGYGHPGFGWAFKRQYAELLIPEFCLIGSGDTVLAECNTTEMRLLMYGEDVTHYRARIPKQLKKTMLDNCIIYHLFHGTLENRQYSERKSYIAAMLQKYNLSKLSDMLQRRADGLFEIQPTYRDELNSILKSYFQNRQDDGV